jgi:hypothetical protein
LLPGDCTPNYSRVAQTNYGDRLGHSRAAAGVDTIVMSTAIPESWSHLATTLHEYAHILAHVGPAAREKNEHQCEIKGAFDLASPVTVAATQSMKIRPTSTPYTYLLGRL